MLKRLKVRPLGEIFNWKKKKKVEKGRVRVTDILLNRHERNQENSSINKINKYSMKIKSNYTLNETIFFSSVLKS